MPDRRKLGHKVDREVNSWFCRVLHKEAAYAKAGDLAANNIDKPVSGNGDPLNFKLSDGQLEPTVMSIQSH